MEGKFQSVKKAEILPQKAVFQEIHIPARNPLMEAFKIQNYSTNWGAEG